MKIALGLLSLAAVAVVSSLGTLIVVVPRVHLDGVQSAIISHGMADFCHVASTQNTAIQDRQIGAMAADARIAVAAGLGPVLLGNVMRCRG